MYSRILLITVLCTTVLSSCNPGAQGPAPASMQPTAIALPTASPTLTVTSTSLQPAPNDTYGVYNIPIDTYLCLEYWLDIPDKGYLDFPYYSYESGTLRGHVKPLPNWATVRGFIGYGARMKQGSGAYSFLETINTLPFTILMQQKMPTVLDYTIVSPAIALEAIDAQGRIVVRADKQAYFLNAGQSWIFEVKDETKGRFITHRLTNYGLMKREQIDLW